MAGSGRSGFLTNILKKYPEEASGLDTMFSPLGTAIGSIIGAFLIISFDYYQIFLTGGIIVLLFVLLTILFAKK